MYRALVHSFTFSLFFFSTFLFLVLFLLNIFDQHFGDFFWFTFNLCHIHMLKVLNSSQKSNANLVSFDHHFNALKWETIHLTHQLTGIDCRFYVPVNGIRAAEIMQINHVRISNCQMESERKTFIVILCYSKRIWHNWTALCTLKVWCNNSHNYSIANMFSSSFTHKNHF